jgi:hypothetical protein
MVQELFFGLEGPDLPCLVLADAPCKALIEFSEDGLVGIFYDGLPVCSRHDRYPSLLGYKDCVGNLRLMWKQ